MTVEIKFKKLHSSFELPQQATAGAAGFDLRYCGEGPMQLLAVLGHQIEVELGFAMELPAGYEAQIRPRSGLAKKYGASIPNSPGTVDSDYRGPVKVILVRSSYGSLNKNLIIEPGDRVCQMVIQKLPEISLVMVDELDETERGADGFGSTGV